jgi:acetylornithine deacetylase/succinyl-diaminopimelate desuccinylase-like protein
MYRTLRDTNQGLREDVVRFAEELIRTPSLSLGEGRVAELVEAKMKELGYDKVFSDDAGNIVGVLFGRQSSPTVLLNSHMDTVAPGQDDPWESNPFSGHVGDNRLFGLGASDCKGGLAAQVYAGALLKRSLLPLRGNLVVAATAAEENGRSVGVRTLLKNTLSELGIKPTYAILGEPTSLGLYYGHDGWLEVDINVQGANPFHVDDAARAIFSDFESDSQFKSVVDQPENVNLQQLRFEEGRGYRRATVGMARRLRPSENPAEVLGQIKHNASLVAQSAGAVAVDVLVRQENQRLYTGQNTVVRHITHAWSTDPFHPLMERARQALSAAGCEVRPGKWELDRLGMGTAGSVMVNEFQLPTIGYGPGDETRAHKSNEYVEIDRMCECVYGTASIVHSLIGVPVFGWTTDEI